MVAPPVLRGGGRNRARCARQDVAALCAATDSRSPGGQGHTQRPRRRTLVARGRRWARWGVARGSREPRRANVAAITGRELKRRRGPHARPSPDAETVLRARRPDKPRCRPPAGGPRRPAAGRAQRPRDGAIARALLARTRRRGDARNDRDPRCPTTWGPTPGANPGTGTPRKPRPAGSRTSRPSGATSRNCHSNKHFPLISKISGANPEKGLSYPERPPPGS